MGSHFLFRRVFAYCINLGISQTLRFFTTGWLRWEFKLISFAKKISLILHNSSWDILQSSKYFFCAFATTEESPIFESDLAPFSGTIVFLAMVSGVVCTNLSFFFDRSPNGDHSLLFHVAKTRGQFTITSELALFVARDNST